MRVTFLFALMLLSLHISAQELKIGDSKYGIEVKYKYTLLKKKKKKDQYLLMVDAINNGDKDLYYAVSADASTGRSLSFAPVNIRNTKGIFANTGAFPIGNATPFRTKAGHRIFKVRKGVTYKGENKFSVAKDATPVLTNNFPFELKDLKSFDIQYMSDPFISTAWISDCGNFEFNLKYKKVNADTIYITQFVNGREFKYQHTADGIFIRIDNASYSITYAKDGSGFFYMAEDGVICNWKRKEELN